MIRFALVIACVVPLTLALLPAQLLALRYGWRIQRTIPQLYHRIVCRLIGVRIRQVGRRDGHGPVLILANHVSWLDICVISALAPVAFVAKSEVATWPLFGALAKLQRTIFIDRQARHRTGEATAEIGARLADGDAVVLFAEGTSSDGSRVLPFRSALVGAVHHALGDDAQPAIGVQPMAVTYTGFGGAADRPRAARARGVVRRRRPDPAFRRPALGRRDRRHRELGRSDPATATDRKAITRDAETSVRRMCEAARRAGVRGALAPRPETSPAPQSEPQFEPA